MEHEVFVPVPADRLRAALSDPERVARAVPGLQQEAGAAPVAGRLRVRVAGHTITYRGALRVTARDDGTHTVEGDGTEARGSGSVELRLTVRLLPAEGGTTVAFTGTATADGRVADLPADAVSTAVTRLLNRFADNLATASDEGTAQGLPPEGGSSVDGTGTGATTAGAADIPEPAPSSDPGPGPDSGPDPDPGAGPGPGPEPAAVFDTEVPPVPLDPVADDLASVAPSGPEEPPAEAAHARRTMIGRSAEEVDHAPPRGRYAPVPAPESHAPGPALRWAAPAAALALASAIVVTRALRKRR
ncbi:hypothetical protein GCM10010145_54150 [Streptomyces ruber]|uniref:Carbon monoxide dehydrogenase subunit G n=2 Tax=Streptomyces TaxID=1883 RepID=A0A918BL79_9ACTN|nr:SRPBCC family protein [Streptomyces ruber]GGQ77584.1 hypothetical protein GCM10010145_54150 [Streptomyces ruber]